VDYCTIFKHTDSKADTYGHTSATHPHRVSVEMVRTDFFPHVLVAACMQCRIHCVHACVGRSKGARQHGLSLCVELSDHALYFDNLGGSGMHNAHGGPRPRHNTCSPVNYNNPIVNWYGRTITNTTTSAVLEIRPTTTSCLLISTCGNIDFRSNKTNMHRRHKEAQYLLTRFNRSLRHPRDMTTTGASRQYQQNRPF